MGFHRSSESALGRVLWVTERDVAFDAPLLKPGGNVIALTKHARAWTDGVLYDYLRLEIDPDRAR